MRMVKRSDRVAQRRARLFQTLMVERPETVEAGTSETIEAVRAIDEADISTAEESAKLIGKLVRHPDFTFMLLVLDLAWPSVGKVRAVGQSAPPWGAGADWKRPKVVLSTHKCKLVDEAEQGEV